MPSDELLAKAINILEKHGPHGDMSLDVAIETLLGFPPFDSIDELEPIAQAALQQRIAPPPMPRPDTGQRGGHGILQTRPAPSVEMLSAPYRFVTLNDHVVLAQTETTKACWGFPIPGGFSGEIAVEWAFETPMLIGVEKDHVSGPMKLGGNYVIPGATLRGAMRAAMGIVCRARLTQVNINHRYGVRDFTHPLFKEGEGEGAQRLAWDRLGPAGCKEKGFRGRGSARSQRVCAHALRQENRSHPRAAGVFQ